MGFQNVGVDSIVAMGYPIHRGFVVKTTETDFLFEEIASDFLESYALVALNEAVNDLPAL